MVCGIDFSTSAVDVVKLADEGRQLKHHRFAIADPRGPFFAARQVGHVFPGPSHSFWDDVWLVGIEDPYSPSGRTTKALGLIAGAIAAQLPVGMTVIQTPPGEWQPMFCEQSKLPSRGKERKALVARYFRMWQGPELHDWSQDAIDAAGIAWTVRELNQKALERGAA